MADEFKIRVIQEVDNVILGAGVEIIHTDDFVAFFDEFITQMTAEESRSTGNKYASSHCILFLLLIFIAHVISEAWSLFIEWFNVTSRYKICQSGND
jgi:hypothetical protein